MGSGEFVVPAGDEILDALGVVPESSPEDPIVQVVAIEVDDESLAFSYDVVGRSVRVQWSRAERPLLDLFRESAVAMSVSSSAGEAWISVRFESESLAGRLRVRTHPNFRIEDELLIH